MLGHFFDQGLLDQLTFMNWVTIQVSAPPAGVTLPQFAFVARLCNEYFHVVVSYRGFAIPVIEGCLLRLEEVSRDLAMQDGLLKDLADAIGAWERVCVGIL